jgi:hypothetical protein
MKLQHVIYIPFRGVGIKNGDDEWFKDRIEVFKQYTLKSLLNQTNKNFVLWLSFRPEDRGGELVSELLETFKDCGFYVICTYEGLMYWDDKNLEANKTLTERVGRALQNELFAEVFGDDNVLMTRLDSDDMLHKDAVGEIQDRVLWDDIYEDWSYKPQSLVFLRGLVYNTDTQELAEWRPRTNPPFHTIIFPKDTFFDAKKHVEFYGDWQSHEDTILVWPFTKLSDYKYCVTVRPQGHISTNWDHHFRGKPMDKELLKDFGIC